MGGKTGTTNSNADGWFMGFTPKLVVGAWVGGEDMDVHFTSMSNGQGAAAALPIYGLFMKKVYGDEVLTKRYGISQEDEFEIPEDFDMCENELSGLDTPEGGDNIPVEDAEGRPRRSLKHGTTYHSATGFNIVRRARKGERVSSGESSERRESEHAEPRHESEPRPATSAPATTPAPVRHETQPAVAPPPPPTNEGHIDNSFE